MKIVVADDEQIILESLVGVIKEVVPQAHIMSFIKPNELLNYLESNECDIAFLDIEMGSFNGIEVAKELKIKHPKINIIFVTGYDNYAIDAFKIKASGYILKPFNKKDIEKEIQDLRNPIEYPTKKRITIHTFGNFEIYVDKKVMTFKYEKTKEMLAYLVDRNGSNCKNGEIMSILWEDQEHISYLSNLKKDLLDTLKKENLQSLIESSWGKMRINKEIVDCDYYKWLEGDIAAINLYNGEYMSQYSWAEFTNAAIYHKNK